MEVSKLTITDSNTGDIKSLIGKMVGIVHSGEPLKERIAHSLYRLNTQREKLEQKSLKLQQRDREIFERCIAAKLSKDYARAAIYANECAEIRTMAKVVISAQLALERAVLRLQTIEEFGDVLIHMAPVVGVVKETRGKLAGVIPEVAFELDDINSMLSNTLVEAGQAKEQAPTVEASSTESGKVLDEANAVAEQRMREQYPELPETPMVTEKLLETSVPTALTAGGEEEIPIEDQVYDYIKECQGELNISRCAAELGVSSSDIRKVIDKLQQDGKIRIR